MTPRPALLLSLPRSGSTLVQRVLSAHPRLATSPEPWLLLPLAYALRPAGARAEYSHPGAAMATADFADGLPGGREAFLREMGRAATRLYELAAPEDAEVFLDKTPRYHLIARDLPAMLPDARLVILWRNPLAVLASMLETFRRGRFEPHLFSLDLVDGIANLAELAEAEAGSEALLELRYEELLEGEDGWRRLFGHLELDFEPSLIEGVAGSELVGRFGDPTGSARFTTISSEPATEWAASLTGVVRRRWCRRYLEHLGHERLRRIGYEPEGLLEALDRAGGRRAFAGTDLARLAGSRLADSRRHRRLQMPDHAQPIGAQWGRPTRLERLRARVTRR